VSRRKPRQLRPDETVLWEKVVEKASPLHPGRPAGAKPASAAKTAANTPVVKTETKQPPAPAQTRFRVGEASPAARTRHDLANPIREYVARAPLAMDHKSFTRMKKGRLSPEARIDLHGMTLAQAHPALTEFILSSAAKGRRLVLVITGKGKSKPEDGPIPVRHGVLRHQVPHWLHSAPLKPHILQLSEAHLKHGGEGAYYVYLRRNR